MASAANTRKPSGNNRRNRRFRLGNCALMETCWPRIAKGPLAIPPLPAGARWGEGSGLFLFRQIITAARPNRNATAYPTALSWCSADKIQPVQLQNAQKTIHPVTKTGALGAYFAINFGTWLDWT